MMVSVYSINLDNHTFKLLMLSRLGTTSFEDKVDSLVLNFSAIVKGSLG